MKNPLLTVYSADARIMVEDTSIPLLTKELGPFDNMNEHAEIWYADMKVMGYTIRVFVEFVVPPLNRRDGFQLRKVEIEPRWCMIDGKLYKEVVEGG